MSGGFPEALQFSFAERVNQLVDWLVLNYGDHLRSVSDQLLQLLVGLENLLRLLPWWALLLLVGLLAWHASRSLLRSLMMVALLALIGVLGLWDKLLQTLALVLVSTGLCVLVGVPLGIMIGWSRLAASMVDPTIQWLRPVPITAWLPISIAIFGISDFGAVFLITIGAFYPIVINTTQGARDVDKNLMRAARMMGASSWTLLYRVVLPAALPNIFTGMQDIHGPLEWVSVQDMEAATRVCLRLVELAAKGA